MLEEAVPAIWASVNSWFTPTVLFVLLNVVIGTIAVTSKGIHRAAGGGDSDADQHPAAMLARSPSLVLERLRSFNLYRHSPSPATVVETAPPPEPPALKPDPPSAARLQPLHVPDPEPLLVDEGEDHPHHFERSQSDTQPTAGEMPGKLAQRIKKSASAKSAFAHFEDAEIVRRPTTTRAAAPAAAEEEEEVDARADDFINRFRQQLKLQRLDSIIRYKEMLNRGQ